MATLDLVKTTDGLYLLRGVGYGSEDADPILFTFNGDTAKAKRTREGKKNAATL